MGEAHGSLARRWPGQHSTQGSCSQSQRLNCHRLSIENPLRDRPTEEVATPASATMALAPCSACVIPLSSFQALSGHLKSTTPEWSLTPSAKPQPPPHLLNTRWEQ